MNTFGFLIEKDDVTYLENISGFIFLITVENILREKASKTFFNSKSIFLFMILGIFNKKFRHCISHNWNPNENEKSKLYVTILRLIIYINYVSKYYFRIIIFILYNNVIPPF